MTHVERQALEPGTMNLVTEEFDGLRAEFRNVVASEEIETCLEESLSEFRGSKVEKFIPLLARRVARQRLQATARGSRVDATVSNAPGR